MLDWMGRQRFLRTIELNRSSSVTVASPAASDTITSLTPLIPFSAFVTVLVQPPQVIPVTFNNLVWMVMLLPRDYRMLTNSLE